MVMTEGATPTAAGPGGITVLRAPGELDLATAGGLAAQGCALAGRAGLLLLDLTSLSFCDAGGLSALVRIANQADRAGCRVALIAPQPPVAKVLRICRLDQRLPVFATTGHAVAALTAAPAPVAGGAVEVEQANGGGADSASAEPAHSQR
jgi:anti-anti-sigma factor